VIPTLQGGPTGGPTGAHYRRVVRHNCSYSRELRVPEEENKKTLWDYLKDQLGINWESIERIKFAGGVVEN